MADTVISSPVRIGSDKQHDYAISLLGRMGEPEVTHVLEAALGYAPTGDLPVKLASKVLSYLESELEIERPNTATKRGETLSAQQLRRIATLEEDAPDHLDEDSQWVLDQIERAQSARDLLTGAAGGMNHGKPILMEQLVVHFGSWDRLARAFSVTVPTAKAWGSTLPANRAYEAEVKTNRRFRAPKAIGSE